MKALIKSILDGTGLVRFHHCVMCSCVARHFNTHGSGKRPNACCPQCGALERHRFLWIYIGREGLLDHDRTLRVLQFAPSKQSLRMLRGNPSVELVTTDLFAEGVDVKADIRDLRPFEDDSFDVIICSHVLEHIVEDTQAMAQIYRVLRPGGTALLQIPMYDLDETFEDPTVTDPAERERLFSQCDHVRHYGRDIVDRLRSVGFDVTVVDAQEYMGPSLWKRNALYGDPHAQELFVVRK